jgi:hypothetical protein
MESLHEDSHFGLQPLHDTCGAGAGAGGVGTGGGWGGAAADPRDGQRPEEGRTSMARTAATVAAVRARPAEREAIRSNLRHLN